MGRMDRPGRGGHIGSVALSDGADWPWRKPDRRSYAEAAMALIDDLATWQLIAVFAASAGVVVGAGVILARSGDQIATRTGLGGLFVGMLLLAAATSLPEIVTDVSAAASGAPDLAIGDLFGSSMANMAILAFVDLLHRGRVWPSTTLGHARLASIAIALTAIMLLGIVSPLRFQIGWIGLESVLVVVAYVMAAAWIHRSQRGGNGDAVLEPIGLEVGEVAPTSVRRATLMFAGAGLLVLIAAPVMARSAHGLAGAMGIAESFLGITLLGLATSLPELVTSVAAVRIGAYALAVGNLFGSNALNATVVLFADAAYTPGPILAAVSPQQLVAGLGAILLMAIATGGMVHGARLRFERGEPDAILLLLTYVLLLGVLWAGA
jgi:cation:H+ antiporter